MILALPEGILSAEGGALFEELVPGMLASSIGILIRGKGPKKYGDVLMKLTKNYPENIGIIEDDEKALRRLFAGSDASLFLEDNVSDELLCALKYGSVPIAHEIELLSDYNPVQESGNAFVFAEKNVWHAFAALVRALETFKLPYDFRTIQKNAMEGGETEDRR
jgi:glycogen synthase